MASEPDIAGVLQAWKAKHPELGVCVFLPEAGKSDVPTVQACCRRLGVPLVGAVFPALVNAGAFQTSGVLLLGLPTMPYFALHEALPADTAQIDAFVDQVARDLRAPLGDERDSTLFLLFDALVPNISTLLDALYLKLANRVHYAGANAGSESFQPMPCLFDSQRFIRNGLLLMLLQPHRGAILEHGYQAPGHSVYATSTEGNCIAQIDWEPAFEVYRRLVQQQFGVAITRDNFYQLAVHYPFGILRANHHVLVRIPVQLGEDGSLFCVGEIPANSVLTLLERPAVDSRQTLDKIEQGLHQLNGEATASDLLLFYCAGRRLHLGAEPAGAELRDLAARVVPKQIVGALSLGEIGGSTTWGYPLFHNATLVALLWRRA
jgi:hypothetical protein